MNDAEIELRTEKDKYLTRSRLGGTRMERSLCGEEESKNVNEVTKIEDIVEMIEQEERE